LNVTIEIFVYCGYRHLWLECDSTLVCQAFSSPQSVLWVLRGRWIKCLKSCVAWTL